MRLVLFLGLALGFAGCDSTGVDPAPPNPYPGGVVEIDARQTYLRTASDRAVDAPAIPIEDLGLTRGGEACFETTGDFYFFEDFLASERGTPVVTAVFGNTPGLEPASYALRLVVPVNAGEDVVTPPTDIENLPTDIPFDFVPDGCVDVPQNARYLFFSAYDGFFANNRDALVGGQPLQVRVTSG